MILPRFRSFAWVPLAAIAVLAGLSRPAQAGNFQVGDLFRMRRISDPQLSPDGKRVAFVVADVHMAENTVSSCLWVVPAEGGEPRQLTRTGRHDSHPRWSPDGRWIAFESDRDAGHQIWLIPMEGGESRRITSLSSSAGQPTWSRDGRRLAFVSGVFPEYSTKGFAVSDGLNRSRLEAREKGKVRAHLETELLYRHWDIWREGIRQHLFVMPISNGNPGQPYDATPGDRDAVPTSSTFDGGDEFVFAPDGGSIVHTAEPVPSRIDAWSTNLDILAEDFGTGKTISLTTNPAADGLPRYSPDGKTLAYRAQARPGFESDLWEAWVLDLASGARRSLTAGLDLPIDELAWAPDAKTIYALVEEKAASSIYALPAAGGTPAKVWSGGTIEGLRVSPDGRWLYFAYNSLMRPSEITRLRIGSSELSPVTRMNAGLMASMTMAAPESVTVPGEGAAPVQMWIVKPPGFDPARKYPLVLLVHGGPQGHWEDGWSYRWNPELWAAQGYVVVAPNPRGSVGFGQVFTDQVSRDWGGRVYVDLMDCVDWMEKQPYVDGNRMAAAGASFGGYMMNWIQGHTTRFRALVTHDGTFNFDSMYGTTDELWFVERDTGVPWETPDFDRFSPHKYAANFQTPDLVIQNELDYRVAAGEGEQLFTILQRKGIPSKLLSFPDEGHWVLKPQNSELWHRTVFDWLATYLKH